MPSLQLLDAATQMSILQIAILIAGEFGRTRGIKHVKVNPVPQKRACRLAG